MKKSFDILIIGAGPSGIFTALQLVRNNSPLKIAIADEGLSIKKRRCPKATTGRCINCRPCHITTGFSGAGAFSDGKLSLSTEVGGDLPMLIGDEEVEKMISYTDKIYLEYGADTKIEG
ncbi:MAG: FAD-dependent oxidoreductase, partial [Clostridia bacterium]